MEVIVDPQKPVDFSTSAAIGNFDGVHLGHKEIISMINGIAERKSTRSCLLTFDPHPQKVLAGKDVSLIVPVKEKLLLLEQAGIDCAVSLKFTRELSQLSAEEFVENVLIKKLRIKDIVVGPDFMFGKNRSGNAGLLKEMGKKYGFETHVINPRKLGDEVISSSLIRQKIADGEIVKLNNLLGYEYFLRGTIVEGEKRGREIGFPTTNIDSKWELLPKPGVYATMAVLKGTRYKSITNIGFRPTFGHNKLLIETHLFDFSGSVYGEEIKVEFYQRLRDEKKFESVDDLIACIILDVEEVKNILTNIQ